VLQSGGEKLNWKDKEDQCCLLEANPLDQMCVRECVCIYLIDGYLRRAGMNTLIMQNSLTWTSKNLKQAHIHGQIL